MEPSEYALHFLFTAIDNLISAKTWIKGLILVKNLDPSIMADVQELIDRAEKLKQKIKAI